MFMNDGEDSLKTRVLVVDDDKTLLDMYTERLKASGYMVYFANDGEEALSRAVDTLPHVILLDVMMPKINGFDVLGILKKTPETRNIPVIILTALAQENHRKKGLGEGASDYIVKSDIMPREVIQKIEAVIADQKEKLEKLGR
jgi:DNA-binding response OmpR family regulator